MPWRPRWGSVLLVLALLRAGPTEAALVSHWAMNENTGTSVADSISSHNGTFAGPVSPVWVTGHPGDGSGLSFPNTPTTEARITVTNHADFSPSATLTLVGWMYMATVNSAAIITKVDTVAGTPQWQMIARSAKTLRCSINSGGSVVHHTTTATIPDATWTFLACAWGSNVVHAYINGTEDGTGTATTGTMSDNGSGVVLGNSGYSGGYIPCYGTIDEVRFYNTQLTQPEIAALMGGGPPPVRKRVIWLGQIFRWLGVPVQVAAW